MFSYLTGHFGKDRCFTASTRTINDQRRLGLVDQVVLELFSEMRQLNNSSLSATTSSFLHLRLKANRSGRETSPRIRGKSKRARGPLVKALYLALPSSQRTTFELGSCRSASWLARRRCCRTLLYTQGGSSTTLLFLGPISPV